MSNENPAQELEVLASMPLSEFMRLYRVDEDLGLRFVREIIDEDGIPRRTLTTIKPIGPDSESRLSIRQEALEPE